MSDVFSLLGNSEDIRSRQAQQNQEQINQQGYNPLAARNEQFSSRFKDTRERNEHAQHLRERYGFDYSIDQYAALGNALDKGIIDEDQAYDILAAQTISDNFKRQGIDIDPLQILENLPAYNEYILGRAEGQSARTPKGNLAAIRDSFVISGSNMRKNFLGMQLADARNNNNPELENIIKERLRQENEIIEKHGDYQKRNFFVEAAKFAAQSSVYTLYVTAGGMLGGGIGAFLAGWSGASGQSYLGLTEAGVNHKLAYPISIAMGAVNAIIESQLGNAAGLVGRVTGARTLQQSIAKRAAAFVSDKLHLSGTALKMATGPFANYLLESLGETSEEVFQEISDIVFEELAAFLQGEGVELDRSYIKRIAEAGKGGFMASLFMGIPGLSIDTVGSVSDYRTLRTDADAIPSEQLFKERNMNSPLRGEMNDEEWNKELSKIHQGRQNIREQEEARVAAELRETAGLGEGYAEPKTNKETGEPIPLGGLYRKKNGELSIQFEKENNIIKFGDTSQETKTNLQGHIEYEYDKEANKITIGEYKIRSDLDTPELRREFYSNAAEILADNYPGAEIAWNPNTEKAVNIREDLIRNNPLGEKAGLNYYAENDKQNISEARYRNRVIDNFKRYFPQLGNTEHAVMAAEWEHFANMQGTSLEEYVNREFGSLDKAFTADPDRRIDAAAKEGKQIKGAVSFEGFARDAKAAIYLSKNADLTTFIHEMGHIYRRRLQGDMLAQAVRLWGVREGKWTTAQEEQFTEDLERWRRDGQAPTSEMQSFFEKFAEFLKKLVNAISQRDQVSPEIKEFFDQLYTGEKTDSSGTAKTIQEGYTQSKAGNDTAAGTEGAQLYEGFTEEELKGTMTPQERREWHAKQESQEFGAKPKQSIEITGDAKSDLQKVYALWDDQKSWDEFNQFGQWLEDTFGGILHKRSKLKDEARALRKIKGNDTAADVLDINGMTLIQPNLEKAYSVMRALREKGGNIVRGKDRYTNKADGTPVQYTHYRDFLLNVQLENGAVFELQINTPQMFYAKVKMAGHTIYEITDQIHENGIVGENITLEEQDEIDRLCDIASWKLYDTAFEAVYEAASFNASSLDMTSELVPISDHFQSQSRGTNSSLLSDKTLKSVLLWPRNASGLSSQEINVSAGSSNDGTSTVDLEDVNALSGETAEAGTTGFSDISVPSTNSIALNEKNVNSKNKNISEKNSPENEKRISTAREKWEAADRIVGAKDQITLQTGEILSGHYELGEAGIATASVDPDAGFTLSEGFPVNDDGTSMNVGRDYTKGFAREAAEKMGADYDQRGVCTVVDANGIVASRNNGDISRRIAAKKGTDAKYISYLKSRPERWGFTQADIDKYKHTTLYFVIDAPASYSPLWFDQFNRSGKKSISPLETAIKMTHLIEPDTVSEFSRALGNYDSISELYEDTQAATEIFKSLMKKGIVSENSYPDYVESLNIKGKQQERVTSNGKEFLESVMLGSVLNEDSIRSLSMAADIRKRVVKGLAALVDNAAFGEYGVISEINQAVGIAVEVQTNKKTYKGIEDYAGQNQLDMGQRVSTDIEIELASRLLEKTEYGFADMMGGLNAVLREEARGQNDIFGGTSKDDILRRYLGVKAKANGIREANAKIIESKTAAGVERVRAAIDNAGLARSEADGTLFQTSYHGSPYRFDRFDSSHMGKGEGAQAYGWGHYFASKREVAEWYRERLVSKNIDDYCDFQYLIIDGRRLSYEEINDFDVWDTLGEFITNYNIKTAQVILGDYSSTKTANVTKEEALIYKKAYELIKDAKDVKLEYEDSGQLYEVDIPGDEMLDWDKPFSEQPEQIKKILRQEKRDDLLRLGKGDTLSVILDNLTEDIQEGQPTEYTNNPTGEELYHAISREKGSPQEASKYFYSLGIKGIRYLDGMSRRDGEGSHNYVIFSDYDIQITNTLFQLSDEQKETIEAAKEVYGTTVDFKEAGYLLADGTMLDLSGKNQGGEAGHRYLDHREMNYFEHNGKEYSPGMDGFMVMGNIRLMPEMGGIELTRMPTIEQLTTLRKFIRHFNGDVTVDFSEGEKLNVVNSVTYSLANAAKVINDIVNYYEKGIVPEQNQTFFQLDDQLVEDAAQYDSWREFRDAYEEDGELSNADNVWYRSLWNDAQKIHNTLFQEEEEKTTRAQELDKRFTKEADKEYLAEALIKINGIIHDKSLEPAEGEDRGRYDNTRRLAERIRRELPNSGSVIGMAAQVNSGKKLSSTQYDRLKRFIRNNTREYRSILADVMGQEEYLEDLADTAGGEPHARLANPKAERTDTMERLKEIGREIGDPELQRAIESGEITFDDPRIAAYDKGRQSEYLKASEAIKALETEMGEDFARLANDAKKRMVRLYEDMLAAKERLTGEKDRLNRMVEDGIKTADSYRRQERLEQASYEQAYKAFNYFAETYGIEADVRESLARREARAAERVKQKGLNKNRRALAAFKEIKRKLIRRITRNVSFKNIAYDQAVVIKTIQRIFEPSIIEGVNKWIGGVQEPLLREVWSQWSTDEQYRKQMADAAGENRYKKIAAILGKDWDFVTTADKKNLFRLLPKADFARDLGLEELIKKNKESVQLDIDEKVVNGQAYFILGAKLERTLKDTIGNDLYNRIQNKPLGEWTIAETEELARVIDALTVDGRQELRAKKEAGRIINQRYRDKILEAVKKTGIGINADDTPEEKERKQKEIDRILGKYAKGDKRNTFLNNFFDANLRRFTTAMDGGRKGIFTSLMYWGENDAYNKKERHIAERRALVEAAMKENNITLDELYKEVGIPGLEGTDLYRVSGGMITVDDLLYIMRGYQNEETRKAITYGNFSNADERTYYKKLIDNLKNDPEAANEAIKVFSGLGHSRLMTVMSFAKNYFAKPENKKFLELSAVIGEDYDRNGERMNQACIEMFNRPMWRVNNYVPMNRREQSGDVNENRVIEDFLGIEGAGQKWVGKGFTEKRINISPYHQSPIELGLYKTWAQSIDDTEHLLAYGPLVQTLNAVFKGYDTGNVRQAIGDRWGKAANERIADTIAEFANPNAGKLNRSALDNFVRSLRGKTATAYLAWKTSSVLKQAVTSPWPYLQEIPPPQYLAACFEVAGGFGKVNDFIREKSIYMKNRDFDPMMKLVKEQMEKNKNRIGHAVDQFNALGMKGLEAVDWAAVAPGWLAKYRIELANIAGEQEAEYQKLLEKYHGSEWADILPTEESKVNRALSEIMNDERQDYEAVARADDAVRRMQPSSRATDLAQMFKGRNEVLNAFLQFQMALNVIWQNIRYDLPLAVKEKQVWTVVGMVTGYALAGIGLGLLLDDDDEEEKEERNKAKWILYNSLTQFTDAVPLLGEGVSYLAEYALTGKTRFQGQQNLLPVAQKAFAGGRNFFGAFREDDPEKKRLMFAKAAGNFGEAVGIRFGLPVSGIKELGKTAGIGDGDGELDFYWQALLGQRKK